MIKEEEIILKASRPFQIIFYGVFYSKKDYYINWLHFLIHNGCVIVMGFEDWPSWIVASL